MAKKKVNKFAAFILCLAFAVVGAFGGGAFNVYRISASGYDIPATEIFTPEASSGNLAAEVVKSKDLSIHFLELGNKYTGDCTFIKAGNTEILVDAGSRESSVLPIYEYVKPLIDGNLDYVIVTHAHQDHYAGFSTGANTDSVFDLLRKDGIKTETVITFEKTNQKDGSKLYKNFKREIEEVKDNGGKCYGVQGYIDEKGNEITLSEKITLELLEHKFYKENSKTENNYSVCFMINQIVGTETERYLFTGDLEEDGEKSLVEKNADLDKVRLYKAGHHGSKTSSSKTLMEKIKPEVICVCACAGSTEYTKNNDNTFPTQKFCDIVSEYTDKVYVTTLCVDYQKGIYKSMNGNIVCYYDKTKGFQVNCSNDSTVLKDTEWFKNNRTVPGGWKKAA